MTKFWLLYWFKRVVLVLVIFITFCFLTIFSLVIYNQHRVWIPTKSDVAIVLGARVYEDGELSLTLIYRLERAMELYDAGVVKNFIVCGAQGKNEPITESEAMKNYLVQHGVEENHIFMENDSYNTDQNIKNAKAIMTEQGLNSAVIVTSDYHVCRALSVARKMGIEASGAAAKTPDTLWTVWQSRVRETLSWIKYLLGLENLSENDFMR